LVVLECHRDRGKALTVARYNNETELNKDVLQGISDDLADLAAEYADLAGKVERSGLSAITVENYKSLLRGFEAIRGHLVKTFSGYQRARLRSDVSGGVRKRPETERDDPSQRQSPDPVEEIRRHTRRRDKS